MAYVPISGASSYCTPAEFLLRKDVRPLGQLTRDDGTTASPSDLATDPVLGAILKQASGMLESACVAGSRYAAVDLRALVDSGSNGGEFIKGIVADLAAHLITERRWSGTADTLAGYQFAMKTLQDLRDGVVVLPFVEVAASSNPVVRDMTQESISHLNLLSRNTRAFGVRGSYYPRPS